MSGYDVDIERHDQALIDTACASEGPPGSFDGYYHCGEQKIVIKDTLKGKREARVVLHECMHLCLNNSGLESSKEEALVILLEDRVSQLFKQNPKLIKYLQETL